jgi:UDP-N-acetylmuramoyl-tripeptide--D-alanyl-D-alanine ligase
MRRLGSPLGRLEFLLHQFSRLEPFLFLVAHHYRRHLLRRTRIVAVVGSFGKSTTARGIGAALGGDEKKISQRNAGSFIARALLRARPWQRHAVIEVGINQAGMMARYARLVQPDITVVTCIGSEHNRSLKTLETTRREKAEMIRVLNEDGLAVLNGDDPNVRWMARRTRARVLLFGFDEANDVRADRFAIEWPGGSRMDLHTPWGSHQLQIQLIGRQMAYAALAAATVALHEGVSAENMRARLAALRPTAGRMQACVLSNGAVVLRDDYKSALETIYAALDTLAEIPGRRILVLGAVSEPPGKQWTIYRQLCQRVAKVATRVVLVNSKKMIKLCRASLRAAGYPMHCVESIRQRQNGRSSMQRAAELIRKDLAPGDVVLVKGRSNQRFERIAFELMGQSVGCDIDFCDVEAVNCEHCPRLGP